MQRKTFEITNGDCQATVTVRTEDGFAAIDRQTVEVSLGIYDQDEDKKLKISDREWIRRKQFAAVWSQSEISGDLGFVWCESSSDSSALEDCYQAWGKLPGKVVMDWLGAINTVDTPPNDPELLPPDKLEKKSETTPE